MLVSSQGDGVFRVLRVLQVLHEVKCGSKVQAVFGFGEVRDVWLPLVTSQAWLDVELSLK
jgi:hypothetical protein